MAFWFKKSDNESDNENPPHHSEDGQPKYLKQNLNSINAFIIALVMSYVVYSYNLLQMYWYKSIKPFQTKLKLVIQKYLCNMHASFPSVDSSYNDGMLNGMSNFFLY